MSLRRLAFRAIQLSTYIHHSPSLSECVHRRGGFYVGEVGPIHGTPLQLQTSHMEYGDQRFYGPLRI